MFRAGRRIGGAFFRNNIFFSPNEHSICISGKWQSPPPLFPAFGAVSQIILLETYLLLLNIQLGKAMGPKYAHFKIESVSVSAIQ